MCKTRNVKGLVGRSFLVLWLLLPVPVWSAENDQDSPRLTVSAEGKVEVPPDRAVLSFAVETVGEKLADVQRENQERLEKVLQECRSLEIPSKFIQTSALNVIPEYPEPPRRPSDVRLEDSVPRIIGYRVVHQVNVEVRNLGIVGRVIDRVLKVGANRFSGISWGLQNDQPIKLEALRQAAAIAQAKAETLAQALNLKLVRMIDVVEDAISLDPPGGRYRMATLAMEGARGDASVEAGEISIRGNVTLVYEISQK